MVRFASVVAVLVTAACSASSGKTGTAPSSRDEVRARLLELTPPAGTALLLVDLEGAGTVVTPDVALQCDAAAGLCWGFPQLGGSVTLGASPAAGSVLAAWGGACSGNGACQLVTNGMHEVSAVFQPHTVTAVLQGRGQGTISSSAGAPACAAGRCVVTLQSPAASSVVLTAAPASGSYFAGWYGEGCSGTGTCTVVADRARTVLASFSTSQTAVNVWAPGNPDGSGVGGGTVGVTGTTEGSCQVGGAASACTFHVDTTRLPQAVTLTATPDGHSVFQSWGGACSGTDPCQLSVIQPVDVTAVFRPLALGVTVIGQGTVTASPDVGLSCSSGTCYVPLSSSSPPSLALTATPAAGSTFVGWGGACEGAGSCSVSTAAPTGVVALFQPATGGSAPVISSFSANPTFIVAGQSTTLSWSVTGATGVSINGGVGAVGGSTVQVSPTVTTTYVLTATNANGSSTATVTIGVQPAAGPPAVSSFTATPATVAGGQSSTLSWAVAGATAVTIDHGVGTVTGNSVAVTPAATTTYTLTATNALGSTTATATVTVQGPPVITAFTVAPYPATSEAPSGATSIWAGNRATLAWNVTGAASLSISGGVGTVTGTSVIVTPAATTTYTLTATNAWGTSTRTVTVTVWTAGTAWFLQTRASGSGGYMTSPNKGGANQVTTDGTLASSYRTTTTYPVTAVANPGWQINSVALNGVTIASGVTSWSGTIQGPGPSGTVTLLVTFTAIPYTLTATATPTSSRVNIASISPASLTNVYYGSQVTVTYSNMQSGWWIQSVAVTGASAVTCNGGSCAGPWAAGTTVRVVATVAGNINMVATYNGPPIAVANPGQVVPPGALVTLDGSASIASPTSYTWTVSGAPPAPVQLTTSGATATFTAPQTQGTYSFRLAVTPGTSWTTTSVQVTSDPVASAMTACQSCHAANGVGTSINVWGGWSTSTHASDYVMCFACHVGTNTGGHPAYLDTGTVSPTTFTWLMTTSGFTKGSNFCAQCHATANQNVIDFQSSVHATATGGPNTCSGCHGDAHAARSGTSMCGGCHADSSGNIVNHPFAMTATTACTGCHDPHTAVAAPAGGHSAHLARGYACSVCHVRVIGVVEFDPAGPAVSATLPRPTFDAAAKTCSNVACHSVPAGTYRPPDAAAFDDPYVYTYGGSAVTPSWYATITDTCTACHGAPPTSSGGAWHSGWHGGVNVASALNPDVTGLNRCDTCHPDVTTTVTGAGTAQASMTSVISNPAQHVDGTVDVVYRTNQSPCNGCHGG
jgi:predicted CxxxxCH...CXXCH cytochrome family protein